MKNTQEIYSKANSATYNEIKELVNGFNKAQMDEFNQLVRLGDSKALAAFTVVLSKENSSSNTYQIAYYS
jgi:hypothetical protein